MSKALPSIICLLSILLVLALSACGDDSSSPADSGPALDEGVSPATDGSTWPGDGIPDPVDTGAAPQGPKLSVAIQGTGTVQSNPPGIQCPGTCEAFFNDGTQVTLSTAPAMGWSFAYWAGDCSGSGNCTLVMSSNRSVGAAFKLIDPPWDPAVGDDDCLNAWGTGGSGLSHCDAVLDDYVVVNKSKRNLALCNAGILVSSFRAGLGFTPVGDKVETGDGKTPEGVFYISRLHPTSSYYKAFVVSYPDKEDAARGLADGLITQSEKDQIDAAQNSCTEPPATALGSLIEIHGNGGTADWTWGCVAIEDSEIDLLWSVLDVRDTVVILP